MCGRMGLIFCVYGGWWCVMRCVGCVGCVCGVGGVVCGCMAVVCEERVVCGCVGVWLSCGCRVCGVWCGLCIWRWGLASRACSMRLRRLGYVHCALPVSSHDSVCGTVRVRKRTPRQFAAVCHALSVCTCEAVSCVFATCCAFWLRAWLGCRPLGVWGVDAKDDVSALVRGPPLLHPHQSIHPSIAQCRALL